jgi:Circularly permutated YpsA SLOG family
MVVKVSHDAFDKLTADAAKKLGKPWLHLSAADYAPAEKLLGFISENNIKVLNVAGTADRRNRLWPNS